MNDQYLIKISGDVADITAKMTGLKGTVGQLKDSLSNAMNHVNRFGGMAALAAAGGMAAFVKKAIDAADQLSKMAQKVGVSTETLSTLKHAADISGVSLEALGTRLVRLSKNAAEAAGGAGDAKDTFAALNINLKNNQGTLKSSEVLLKELADRFKGLPDGVEKTNAAVKIFGRSGAELIPMLNQGADGIGELQARAEQLGLKLSTEAGRAAEDFNDQLTDLGRNAEGFGRAIATQALPQLNEYLRIIRLAYDEGGLLHALWVSMGALGDALYLPGLDRQIKALQEAIANPAVDPFTGQIEDVAKLQAQLDGLLQKRKALREQADKDYEARRKQEAADTEARSKAESALRTALETRSAGEAAAKAAAKAEADAHKLSVDLWIRDEAKKWEDLEKWSADYIAQQEKNAAISRAIQEEWARQGRRVIESVMTPMEKYAEKLAELDGLLVVGTISYETYRAAATQAWADAQEAADKTKGKYDDLKNTIDGWGKDSARAIVDFAMTGKTSFKDMINSMIADLLRMVVYKQITSKVASGVGSLITTGLGLLFHGGGVVGQDSPAGYRIVPAAAFASAPRYHSGIGPDERAAILQKGESVLTPGQMKALGAGMSGGEYHTHVHMTINALDSRSVTQTLAQHQGEIVGIVNQAYNKMGKRGPLGS